MAVEGRKIRIPKNSVLRYAELVEVEKFIFWRPVQLPVFEPRDSDVQHLVARGDRIDLLAKRFYGDDRLLWIILWANDINLPELDIYPGVVLLIPARRRILDELLRGG